MSVQCVRAKYPRPSTIRRRALYERRKAELIAQLGGHCKHCGSTEKLTFDHKTGWRTWEPKEVHSTKRLQIYKQEADEGLIQLLCGPCNSSKNDSAEDDDSDWDVPVEPEV